MDCTEIENLLKKTMGLTPESVGRNGVRRAIELGMSQAECATPQAYLQLLQDKPDVMKALIERVVVPETWFFRDAQPFALLGTLAAALRGRGRPIRILSLPCATGEEAYSLAMTLLEGGLRPTEFMVEAVDISAAALAIAQQGVYGQNSFRGDEGVRRDLWFERKANGWLIDPRVKEVVTFHEGNLMAARPLTAFESYDFIFCRNLLIYFDEATQVAATRRLQSLLAPEGVIFVGHAEAAVMLREGLEPRMEARSFAFGRRKKAAARPASPAVRAVEPKRKPAPVPAAIPFASVVPRPAAAPAEKVPADFMHEAMRLADAGQLENAEKLINAGIDKNGPTAEAFYLLGITQDARGLAAKAESSYRKVLYLNPTHTEALAHLALLIDARGDHAGAQRLRQRALRPNEHGGAA